MLEYGGVDGLLDYTQVGAATRVLLAALLSEADECGVVAGLGGPRLRAMTGLDTLSIKHQLKRLLSLGFVRSYMPGLSHVREDALDSALRYDVAHSTGLAMRPGCSVPRPQQFLIASMGHRIIFTCQCSFLYHPCTLHGWWA